MTWNTLRRFFIDVLAVRAANGNLDCWSMMENTYFPLGSGPRNFIFNVYQTSFGKGDGWIFTGGVDRPVDWQAIHLFILSSVALSMPIKNALFLTKAFIFCTPWCPTTRWNIVGKTMPRSFKDMLFFFEWGKKKFL